MYRGRQVRSLRSSSFFGSARKTGCADREAINSLEKVGTILWKSAKMRSVTGSRRGQLDFRRANLEIQAGDPDGTLASQNCSARFRSRSFKLMHRTASVGG